jgi:O-antigen ligase
MFVAALPAALHLLAARMTELAPVLKPSGLMRLEIWDYMTARIFQYPILGWGLLSAKVLPIHPEEMARYIYGDPRGFYPHNQWLELWVELGLLGAALGLAFALLVLRRIRPLPPPIRPFAYAAFAAAMTIASVNYEVVTDSWWAALAACAVLFLLLRHCLPEGAAGGALARTPPPLEGGGRGEGCSPAEDCARGHTSPQPPPSRGGGVLGRSRLPA